VLCLIGGMDRGLRVGGQCCSKLSLRHGTLLGVLKEGSTSAKVLWDDSDAIIRSLVMEFNFIQTCHCRLVIVLISLKIFVSSESLSFGST